MPSLMHQFKTKLQEGFVSLPEEPEQTQEYRSGHAKTVE